MTKEKDYNKDYHVYKVTFLIIGLLPIRPLQLRWGQKGMSQRKWKFSFHTTHVPYRTQKKRWKKPNDLSPQNIRIQRRSVVSCGNPLLKRPFWRGHRYTLFLRIINLIFKRFTRSFFWKTESSRPSTYTSPCVTTS